MHMALGITIGVVGLLFFFLSTSSIFANASPVVSWQGLAFSLAAVLPRLGVLIFIELTAGFFLKQYAIAMEEFRYFERILRRRESELLAYHLRRENGASADLIELATSVLNDGDIGLLRKDQTTTTLEAEATIANDPAHVLTKAVDLVRAVGEKAVTK